MTEQESKARAQRNEQAVARIRNATTRYVAQLRDEGLSEEAIRQMVEGANLEVVRHLTPGEEIPAELQDAIATLVKNGL